jgi:hypothetical protein
VLGQDRRPMLDREAKDVAETVDETVGVRLQ